MIRFSTLAIWAPFRVSSPLRKLSNVLLLISAPIPISAPILISAILKIHCDKQHFGTSEKLCVAYRPPFYTMNELDVEDTAPESFY